MKATRQIKMIPSRTPARSRHKLVLAFSALCSIVFFTACQFFYSIGDRFQNIFVPASSSPTASVSSTPTVRATFTHLPGDLYFLYQTQTAAPPTYPPVRWETSTPTTPTPMYTLTAITLALTKSSCQLAYPDFCVSPNVRLGCSTHAEFGRRNFTVLAPDPYGYDKDGDGIGCEPGE
jgi:hypothetical protein